MITSVVFVGAGLTSLKQFEMAHLGGWECKVPWCVLMQYNLHSSLVSFKLLPLVRATVISSKTVLCLVPNTEVIINRKRMTGCFLEICLTWVHWFSYFFS